MQPEEILIADIVAALVVVTLIGLSFRRRLSDTPAFTLYLVCVFVANRLVTLWPEAFFVWRFWVVKEIVLQVLVITVAFNVGAVALWPFPRARRWTLGVLTAIAVLTAVLAILSRPGDYSRALAVLIPRLSGGAAVAFGVLALVALWSWLPVRRFHRTIVAGFFLHLTAYVALLSLVKHFGWSAYPVLAALDPAAFGASVGLWAVGAWRGGTVADDLDERLWWEIVSPERGSYFSCLEKQLDDQLKALNLTLAEAANAEKAGDPALAAKLREAGRVYAAAISSSALRARSGLALRRRMLAALGKSR